MLVASLTNAAVLTPGTELGKYELIRRLAVGGMAEIYLAKARGLEGFEKLVVLKRILPQHATDPHFVNMFLDEARLAATLQHANIAQVYDVGEDQGCLYFAMEYVDGIDARTLLKHVVNERTRLPMEHALTIVAGVAAGLHAAHEKLGVNGEPLNIVHRDVSPSNVLISRDGCVKLIDFGVAKADQRTTETVNGTLKGKVSYMAPEQCRGLPVDRRADVFALGILLYELTCSRKLFRGTELAILTKISKGIFRRPSEYHPNYPPELERIVVKALARDADERYATAQTLQLDVERFARHHELETSTVKLGCYVRHHFGPNQPSSPAIAPATATLTGEPSAAAACADEPVAPTWRLRGIAAVFATASAVLAAVTLMWLSNGNLPTASAAAPRPLVIPAEPTRARLVVPAEDPRPRATRRHVSPAPTHTRHRHRHPRHAHPPARRPKPKPRRSWDRDSALPP